MQQQIVAVSKSYGDVAAHCFCWVRSYIFQYLRRCGTTDYAIVIAASWSIVTDWAVDAHTHTHTHTHTRTHDQSQNNAFVTPMAGSRRADARIAWKWHCEFAQTWNGDICYNQSRIHCSEERTILYRRLHCNQTSAFWSYVYTTLAAYCTGRDRRMEYRCSA